MCFHAARPLAVFLITLSLTLLGCAGTQLGTGKAGFSRADSQHFTLYTDKSPETARAHVLALERWLSAISTLGFGGFGAARSAPLHVNVVMHSNQREFERYAPRGARGYFVSAILMEPWFFMPETPVHKATTIKHELVHSIAHRTIARQPSWYAEGIAEYFETADFDERGFFSVGEPSRAQLNGVLDYGLLSAEDILRPSPALRDSYRFYVSAWYLVHYLMSHRSEDFATYQTLLGKGTPFEEAFQRAFADLTEETIDKALHDYYFADQFARFRHPIAPGPEVAVTTRSLSVADEHALQGVLWLSGCRGCDPKEARDRASASFLAALRADPVQFQAGLDRFARLGGRITAADLEEARRFGLRHAEHWQAWVNYAFVANAAGKLDDALKDPDPVRELDRLTPYHPYTWVTKAYRYQHSMLPDHAMRSVEAALRVGRQSPVVLRHCIKIFASLNACRELSEAIADLRGMESVRLAPDEERELERLVATCRSPTP